MRNRSSWRVWAADPFLRVFSIWTGVKDALRAPASPAAFGGPGLRTRSRKDLAGYRGGGPGVAAEGSCTGRMVLMGWKWWPFGPLTIHRNDTVHPPRKALLTRENR